jgi:hypothetical protein
MTSEAENTTGITNQRQAKAAVQQAKGHCDCGSSTFITRTPSPWEFDWRCPGCSASGTIAWNCDQPAPEFRGQVIDR